MDSDFSNIKNLLCLLVLICGLIYLWLLSSFLQKLKVAPVPRDQYGTFFVGDSYIVYSAGGPGEVFGAGSRVSQYGQQLLMGKCDRNLGRPPCFIVCFWTI